MKALTLRQPWAGAIFQGTNGKDVENRGQLFSHRGVLAIHAGQQLGDVSAFEDVERILGRRVPTLGTPAAGPTWTLGAVVGLVDLVDAHRFIDCGGSCSPWAQTNAKVHLQLANPRPLTVPVPAYGRQGLSDLPDVVAKQVRQRVTR